MPEQPLDQIEQLNAMRSLALLMRTFYLELVEQGFSDVEALRLTAGYLRSMGGNG